MEQRAESSFLGWIMKVEQGDILVYFVNKEKGDKCLRNLRC